jgi:hypothetical protein
LGSRTIAVWIVGVGMMGAAGCERRDVSSAAIVGCPARELRSGEHLGELVEQERAGDHRETLLAPCPDEPSRSGVGSADERGDQDAGIDDCGDHAAR